MKIKDTVFDYLDYRILSFYHELRDIKKGKMSSPRFLILYPTNLCPFNCNFCDYEVLNKKKKKYLKRDHWKKILNEFRDLGGMGLELCGGGEPLATPHINELIDYSVSLGLKFGILTNGFFIDKKKLPKLYESIINNCSYVRVSMESGSQEMFEKVRRVNHSFERILDNVTEMIQDKNDSLQISYKYTIGRYCDLDDIKRAIELAEERKFDSIQFKPAMNVDDKFRGVRFELEQNIKEIAAKILDKTKLVCNLSRYYLPKSIGCFTNPIQTVIDYNGDVFICCYYRHRTEEHRLGNIFDNSLEEIWYSDKHWNKIKNIDVNKCNAYDCRFIRYNMIASNFLRYGQLEFI